MTELDLKAIRTMIDKLDTTLAETLEQRLDTVLKVAAYKETHQLPVLDAEHLMVFRRTLHKVKEILSRGSCC